MAIKKYDPIPAEDRVVRFVSWGRLEKDQDDPEKVIGILPQEFDEADLSVTWIDHFQGTDYDKLLASACAMRASQDSGKLGSKGHFAKAVVGDIHNAAAKHGHRLRVIYMPEDRNPAHSEIVGLDHASEDLRAEMAEKIFGQLVRNGDLPA